MASTIKKAAIVFVGLVIIVAIAIPTILHKAGVHPEYNGPTTELPGKRALIITTSHAVLNAPGETTGDATGVFGSELTHPYYTFTDGGMSVDVASIQGAEIPHRRVWVGINPSLLHLYRWRYVGRCRQYPRRRNPHRPEFV